MTLSIEEKTARLRAERVEFHHKARTHFFMLETSSGGLMTYPKIYSMHGYLNINKQHEPLDAMLLPSQKPIVDPDNTLAYPERIKHSPKWLRGCGFELIAEISAENNLHLGETLRLVRLLDIIKHVVTSKKYPDNTVKVQENFKLHFFNDCIFRLCCDNTPDPYFTLVGQQLFRSKYQCDPVSASKALIELLVNKGIRLKVSRNVIISGITNALEKLV